MVSGSRRGLAVVGTMLSAVAAAVAVTTAADQASGSPATTGDDTSIVEDYSYPNAAEILSRYNVRLIAGDGHILWADCAMPTTGDIGLVQVQTVKPIGIDGQRVVCFQVTASSGWLDMEVPGVYEIHGDGLRHGTGHHMTAILRTDTEELPPVTCDPSGSTQVGIGNSPDADPTTLLRLTVTP